MAPAAARDRFYEEVSLDVVATASHVEYMRENLGAVEGLVPEGANLKVTLMRIVEPSRLVTHCICFAHSRTS